MKRSLFEKFYRYVNPWGTHEFGREHSAEQKLRGFLIHVFHKLQTEFKIRYLPVLREIKKNERAYSQILEIGSGSLGLSRYTKKSITGIDIHTRGPRYLNMDLRAGDALNVPFAEKSFDLVVSIDVLEHLPKDKRQEAVSEVLRVTRKKAFVAFPCGGAARHWEARVFEELNKIRQASSAEKKTELEKRYWYLYEHMQHGLPSEKEAKDFIEEAVRQHGNEFSWRSETNESVLVWYYSVIRMLKGNYFRWFFTTFLYFLFFFVIKRLLWPDFYRQVFILERK